MFEAQAEMYREQAAHFRKEQAFKDAETRKKLAEAEKEEHYAVNARISRDSAIRSEEINLVQNHYQHIFNFNVGVNEESVEICESQLAIWHRQDHNCDMTIKIDSPGGSVIDGMHLFDEISAYSLREWDTRDDLPKGTHKTTVIVRGWAASMGGILLQAADHRVIGPESFLMIHEASNLAAGKVHEIKDELLFLEKLSEGVTDIFVRRSGGKMTPPRFKKLWDRKDIYLTAREAKSLGFVDEIG